jgi:hypothetical protein
MRRDDSRRELKQASFKKGKIKWKICWNCDNFAALNYNNSILWRSDEKSVLSI